MLKNQKGFAAILILSLLPVFIGGSFLVFTVLGIMQTDLKLKHLCRQEGRKYQEKVLPRLESLLKLNPRSQKLKAERVRLDRLIQAAITRGDMASVTLLNAKRAAVVARQIELDLRQKQLINQSNLDLRRGHLNTTNLLAREAAGSSVKTFLNLRLRLSPLPAPRLAVRPDSADLAPTYSPVPEFESRQALAQEWHYDINVRWPLMQKSALSFNFSKACAVSLRKEPFKWKVVLSKARFSLKSVW